LVLERRLSARVGEPALLKSKKLAMLTVLTFARSAPEGTLWPPRERSSSLQDPSVPARFQISNQRRQKAAPSRGELRIKSPKQPAVERKMARTSLRVTSPQTQSVLVGAGVSRKESEATLLQSKTPRVRGHQPERTEPTSTQSKLSRGREDKRGAAQERGRRPHQEQSNEGGQISMAILRATAISRKHREIEQLCAGRRSNERLKRTLAVKVEGQAGQLSITPCRSTAALCLSGYANRPPRQMGETQWRPNHDLASKRKPLRPPSGSSGLLGGANS
jgi:hypothetical protein